MSWHVKIVLAWENHAGAETVPFLPLFYLLEVIKMKEKSSKLNHKKTVHVFQQLDKCISEAQKAEQTNNWKEAWKEANKLNLLTKCSCTVQIITNSAATLSGVYQRNWILVMVSVSAIFGFIVVLYGSSDPK